MDSIKWRNQFKWQLCQTHISCDWYIKGRPDIISHTSQQRTQRKRIIIRWKSFTNCFLTRFLGPQFADRTRHKDAASLRRAHALVLQVQRLLHAGQGGGAGLVPVEGHQHLEVSHRDLLPLLRHVAHAVSRVILPYQSEIVLLVSVTQR